MEDGLLLIRIRKFNFLFHSEKFFENLDYQIFYLFKKFFDLIKYF